MSLPRTPRFVLALTLLSAQVASFGHLAFSDHTLSGGGHLIEGRATCEAAAAEGLTAADHEAAPSLGERCLVFDAVRAAAEIVEAPPIVMAASSQTSPAGSVRRGFVRRSLLDAPKASPPSRA